MSRTYVVRMLVSAVVALVVGNQAVGQTISVTATPPRDSLSIYVPDFAFPADVKAAAEAFLSKKDPKATPGATVLAVMEIVESDYGIDRLSATQSLRYVLDKADAQTNAATRAMLYAYAANVCRYKLQTRGYYDRPDMRYIDQWSYTGARAAADSLLTITLRTVPADTPIKDYNVALSEYDAALSPVVTVRDFIADCYLSDVSNPDTTLTAPVLALTTPYGVYHAATRLTPEKAVAFIRQLGKSDLLKYAVVALINMGDRGADSERVALYKELESYNFPNRLKKTISANLTYLLSPNWQIDWPAMVPANGPFKVDIRSSNTEHVTLNMYQVGEYINETKEETFDSVALVNAKCVPVRLTPMSGQQNTTVTATCTLPAGTWYGLPEGESFGNGRIFRSTPWKIMQLCLGDDYKHYLQVLDVNTGKPCFGLNVEYTDSKNSKIKRTTDANGFAYLQGITEKNNKVTVSYPGGKMPYTTEVFVWGKYKKDNYQSSITKESGGTSLPVYRPGDTVRWTAFLTDDDKLRVHKETSGEIQFPGKQDRKYKNQRITRLVTDEYGRVQGEFVLPEDCDLGSGRILISGCTPIWYKVSDFKLPELSLTDVSYILKGDSVTLVGKALDRTGSPRPDTTVRISVKVRRDSTLIFNTVTGADGTYHLTLPRFRESGTWSTRYSVEVMTADGYHAEEDSYFENKQNFQLKLERKMEYNVADGMTFTIKVKPYGSTPDPGPQLCKWELYDNAIGKAVVSGEAVSGTVVIPPESLVDIKAGRYDIHCITADSTSNNANEYVILYNSKKPELPKETVIWLPDQKYVLAADGTLSFTVGTDKDDVTMWWIPYESSTPVKSAEVKSMLLKRGYHTVKLRPGEGVTKLRLWAVRDGKLTNYNVNVEGQKEVPELKLSLERFTDTAVPGTPTRWTLVTRFDDKPVAAAVGVNVFDKRVLDLAQLCTPYIERTPRVYDYARFGSLFSARNPYIWHSRKLGEDGRIYKLIPGWRFTRPRLVPGIQVRGAGDYDLSKATDIAEVAQYSARSSSNDDAVLTATSGPVAMAMVRQPDIGGVDPSGVDVRGMDAMSALWAPMLTTDAVSGSVDVDFLLPANPATWAVRAWAWTKDLDYVNVSKSFVARSPIYVNPSTPRFVRVGDRVNIVTAIVNTTDSAQTVTCDVAVGTGVPVVSRTELAPLGTGYVTTTIDVDGTIALGDTLTLTVRASNGTYGDGKRVAIPILPSSALVTESQTFYMNPGEATRSIAVPASTDTTASVTLDFTANPLWMAVKAMPEILDNAIDDNLWPIATAHAQAYYVAQVARQLADRYPASRDVVEPAKAAKAAKAAVTKLKAMQGADGGFRFGSWARESSMYTTLGVLSWFTDITDTMDGDARSLMDRSLAYVDANVVPKGGKVEPDLTYALVRSQFGRPGTLAGQQVMDATINYLVKNWRNLSLNDKPLAAMTLAANGHKAVAARIIESVTQHSVVTPDRGLVLPNLWGPVSYSNYLSAMYAVNSANPTIDAVRQALVCMRRGNDWGNVAQTAYVVRSMVTTGTDWAVPARPVEVRVDGHSVDMPATAALSGAFSMPVAAGDTLTLTRPDALTPAYGAVVTRRIAPLSDVAAAETPELCISKAIYTTDDTGRRVDIAGTTLVPGQKVIVSLTLRANADQSGVVVTDLRPAAFEPVLQMPSYAPAAGYGTWCYIVPRNTQTELFIDRLPRGLTTIEYEAVVAQTGTFTTGVATATNTNDPDLTAHSASTILLVGPTPTPTRPTQALPKGEGFQPQSLSHD